MTDARRNVSCARNTLPLQAALFLVGVLLVLVCPERLPGGVTLALAAAGVLALIVRRTQPVAFLCAGAVLAQLSLLWHYAAIQTGEQRLLAEASIVGIPRLTATGLQFDADLRFPRLERRRQQRARLSWRDPGQPLPVAGDHWQLALRLAPPRATQNPPAVDLERNYLRDHVQAIGAVLDSPLNQRLSTSPASLDALRQRIAERIANLVRDPASGALLAALAVGATGDLSREQWRVFNATGITHLVAISGLHVTLFAMLAMAGARRLWSIAARVGLRARRERFAASAGIALATGYALLAGFSVPTQRTLLMLSSWLVWRAAARAGGGMAAVATALVLVILLDPYCVLSAGFWLSFAAVCAIIWIAGGKLLPQGKLRGAVVVQFAVTVALLPVTIAIFGSMSLAGLAVNIVAIPLFTFLLVPAVLAATAALLCLPAGAGEVLAGLLLGLAEGVANRVLPLLAMVADLDFALWRASPSLAWYLLAALAAALALLPWATPIRLAAALCLLPLLGTSDPLPHGAMRATVFDVGQGTAVLLQTRQHSVLYGTGDTFGSRGGQIERTIIPYTQARGIRHLDMLMLARLDAHSALGVLAVDALLSPERILAGTGAGTQALPPELQPCRAGQAWDWDGIRFEILHPAPDFGGAGPTLSCVLKVDGPGGTLLLPGDVDAAVERLLLARGLGRVDVLLAPRHGAAGASSPGFLQALAPRIVLVSANASSVGRDSYRQMATRYKLAGARLFDTATSGALQLNFRPGTAPIVAAARDGRLGVWSRPAAGPLP